MPSQKTRREDIFGLPRLSASDTRAKSPAKDSFDFNQPPRKFKVIPSVLGKEYFLISRWIRDLSTHIKLAEPALKRLVHPASPLEVPTRVRLRRTQAAPIPTGAVPDGLRRRSRRRCR